MNGIHVDTIRSELSDAAKPFGKSASEFMVFRPSNKNIGWLFRRYDLHEMTEHYYEEEDPNRITWIEPVGPGIWSDNQVTANKKAKSALRLARSRVPRRGRFYIAFLDEFAYIYYYGRDCLQMDYWWIFVRKNKRKH